MVKWVRVPDYENFYRVSDTGLVWSIRKGRLLKPKIDRYGYEVVTLTVQGKSRCFTVHRLVALAFIPNPCKKPTVNHKNEVKTDNRVENLEWATQRENDNYGTRNERMAQTKCRRAVVGKFPDGTRKVFAGVKAASRASGIAHSQITRGCQGVIPRTRNIEWRYCDEICGMA